MAVDGDRHAEAIELEGDEGATLLNEEARFLKPPRRAPRLRRCCASSTWWWITNAVMGIVIIYLAFQLDSRKNLLSRFELAGDITRIGPRRKDPRPTQNHLTC